tara:strand:- start:5638 stop:7944 length:2307 start_codon:yes stop_codon:yes gene_type:complete
MAIDKIQKGKRLLELFNKLKKPLPEVKNKLQQSLENLSVSMNKQRLTLDESGEAIGPGVHNYQKFGKNDFEARQNFRKDYYKDHPEELADLEIVAKADEIVEPKQITKKKFPYLDPENNARIVTGPREGLMRYQLRGTMDPNDVKPVQKYAVYDWWDDATNSIRKSPKFKHVKDDQGNIIMKEEFNIGGVVNKLKTIGSLTKGLKAAEPLGPVSKGQMKLAAPKGPYSIADQSGVRVLDKDFDTVEDAQKALQELSTLRTQDASTFRIFGARPPKTAKGVSYGAPEVKTVSKQDEARMPSMFWKSREEIAEANQNVMSGKQWLAYLKNKGVGDTELKDTSLGYHLMSTPNDKIKKSELLLEFDEMAPKIEAKVLGWRDTNSLVKDARSFINSVIKSPPVYMDQKSRRIINNIYPEMNRMKEIPTGPQMVRLKEIVNKSFKDEFGIDEIIGKGLDPAKKMPFMAKKLALVFDDILNQKGIQYNVAGKPKHAGDQTMSGGQNYQEILFSYKPGVYRQNEKIFTEGHDFGAQSPDNMFVWVRFSDRNDEYGRKILFVEEIQSDMHQGARGKKNSPGKGYVPRKDLYDPDSLEVSKIETALAKIQNQVDEAGGLNVGPLRAQQAKLIKESKKLKPGKKRYKESSDTPEGPFADSKDYGRFIMQYLLRAAKESGDYDGVALASGKIKGQSKVGFYTNIMVPQMKKISKKTGAKFDETVIVDGNGVPQDNIPVLLLKDKKGILPSTEKMKSGISAYNTGGLVRDAFEPIVSPLI